MFDKQSDDLLTVKAVAGTHNVLLAFDLTAKGRPGCLGFSIERTDLDGGNARRWLPNMLRFQADTATDSPTTAGAPLQAFRWGDYTVTPGQKYRYRIVPRYGSAADILAAADADSKGDPAAIPGGVAVQVTAEDPQQPDTAVFFNRGAAASKAYVDKFKEADPASDPKALDWLSRGLKEALLGFLASATGPGFALHAVIYEFQKAELLDALAAAKARGVDVQVVYHARQKGPAEHEADKQTRALSTIAASTPSATDDVNDDGDGTGATDKTKSRNMAAIHATGLDTALGAGALMPRAAAPQGAIMHDKYVVRLRDGVPEALLTGSTNWTDGALYGQLNVAHIINDPKVAAAYEQSFQLLSRDPAAAATKARNVTLTPVPATVAAIPKGVTAVFSPQDNLDMIDLYAAICARAKLLFVSAPFLLHERIRAALNSPSNGALRYVMGDKPGSFGSKGAIDIMNGDPGRVGVVATMLKNPLNDFQGRLLEGRESFHHAGVHIHTKIILADPFGDDPILVGGSANFSTGSTTTNDSNSLIIRGMPAVTDIYATEFMRMFQHYWFRFREDQGKAAGTAAALDVTDAWQTRFFTEGTTDFRDRVMFVA